MNITQSIQTNPAKALALFDQLGDSSDGSVKTRERLLGELKTEIEFNAQVEEAHLVTALRKHKETKSLASDAAAGNRQVRKMLGEMEQAPKDSPEFLGQMKELRQAFQQNVSNEEKELLPALKKVLSDEQMQSLAQDMEADRADANQRQAEQDEREKQEAAQRRIAAKEQREQDEREKQEKAEQRRLAAREKREEAARQEEQAKLQHRRERAVAAMRKSAEAANEAASQEAAAVAEGLRSLKPEVLDDAFGRLTEYGQLWMDFGSATAEATARASTAISRCGSPVQVAQTQLRYATEIGQAWIEAGNQMLEISLRQTLRR